MNLVLLFLVQVTFFFYTHYSRELTNAFDGNTHSSPGSQIEKPVFTNTELLLLRKKKHFAMM